MTRDELELAVQSAKAALAKAENDLYVFDTLPENNVHDTLDTALCTIESNLLKQAHEDCEGSYNCGAEEYTQEFIVDGKHYIGTLTCEYNRHDKTFYYVDGYDFTYNEVAN